MAQRSNQAGDVHKGFPQKKKLHDVHSGSVMSHKFSFFDVGFLINFDNSERHDRLDVHDSECQVGQLLRYKKINVR